MHSVIVPSVLNEEVRVKIPVSKVLVVGAGGIGCEILKNLALSGFENIEIIDLDTIDVSNLNRQFLFRKEHVGKPKAVVARESILNYNPNVNIKAYHDSITSTEFGVNFYKQFQVVLNALDNPAARNHVNRMCLAADVPLVESGTNGYAGQIEFIKKGLTQCYECQLKMPPKTYPGCTIRNTPSEPVHCIVWSKHLFNQLFGEADADQDVSPDTADPEAAGNAGLDAVNSTTDTGNVQRKSTRLWALECDYDPKKLFNKFFEDDIDYLLTMDNLWTSRTPPLPLNWDQAASHEGDLPDQAADNVRMSDMQIWPLSKCASVFASAVNVLKSQLASKQFLIWDKDDKTALDFVTACTNIRAHIFHIDKKSRFDIKAIAGNIVPAIATSNAMIAGLAVLMAFRVLSEEYEKCKSIYLRPTSIHSNVILAPERVFPPANPHCYVCSPQPFIKVFVNTHTMLVKEFESEILKKELNMIAPDVILEGKAFVVISSEEGETEINNEKKLVELGIMEGAILKVDDFVQNYKVTILITHYVATEKEDPLFKVDVTAELLKSKCNLNGSATQNGDNNMEVSGEGDNNVKTPTGVYVRIDPQEGPSTKKHKKNPPEEDDDLIEVGTPL